MLSVNSHHGALIALRQLSATDAELTTVQTRITSGLKVATAKDNGAVNAVAESMRAQLVDRTAAIRNLDRGISALDVALGAGEAVANLLTELKSTALSAIDLSTTTEQREVFEAHFGALRDQLNTVVEEARFNGINLIDGSVASLSLPLSANADQVIKVPTADFRGTKVFISAEDENVRYNVGGGIVLIHQDQTLAGIDDTNWVGDKLIEDIEGSIVNVGRELARFGTARRNLETQRLLSARVAGRLREGIGKLVDADLGRESARLEALRVRHSLGAGAVAIATAQPQLVLSLFS